MKIAICDDEILVARQLEKIVRTAWEKGNAGQRSGELTIGLYTSGTALLEEIEKYDTVFLDLRMPEMDGIEVGKRIREKNPACRIIVATGEVNRFKEGYVIGALRFVTKPFEEEEIAEALEEAAQACLGEGVVEAYFANKPYKLLQKEICYILSYDGYVRLYTKDREYRKDVGLEKLREDLDQRLFAQIDRGVIVNLAFVEQEEPAVFVVAGQRFKIARRRREDAKKAYIDFKLKYKGKMLW